MIFMKKNYFLFTVSICMSLQTSILQTKAKKENLSWEGPAPLSMFKKVRTPEELSSQEISALSTALASTQANAGANALNMLTEIAQNKKYLLEAIYVICKGLTTPDTARNNATPISLATAAVKKTLSTGIIESLNEEYDLTLLHYATLFSVFGGVLKPSPDIKTSATTIINSILTGLTNNEQLAATTAEDMWNSTPVHYALLAPEATQLGVINAIMPTTNIKNSVLSKKNIYDYTPTHYASVFITNQKAIIKAIFGGLTSDEKNTILGLADQWGSTPLHYATLYKNMGMLERTFFTGLTVAQRTTLMQKTNSFDATPIHYASYDASKITLLNDVILPFTKSERTSLGSPLSGNIPLILTPHFEIRTILLPNLLFPQNPQ